ncbi:hypothetical protein [Dictyobacter vulcani]|uniref:hypothetical protein n=1 Tax=Dictyobacter vulcani TaxID=2607529 RepID=UPI00124F8A7D|nr:hypothetical protein [Dictyobacter vulcani]
MNFKSIKPLLASLGIAALSLGASSGFVMPVSAHPADGPRHDPDVCSPSRNEVEFKEESEDFFKRAVIVCTNATANNYNHNDNDIHLSNKLHNRINIHTTNRPHFRNNNRIHNNNDNNNDNQQAQLNHHNDD